MLIPEDIRFVKLWNGKSHIFLSEDGPEKKFVRDSNPPYKWHWEEKENGRISVTTLCGMQGYLRKYIEGTAADGVPGRNKGWGPQLLDCDRCNIVLSKLREGWGMNVSA